MRWLPINGHPGYEVSDQGQVRTFFAKNGRGGIRPSPRPVTQSKGAGKVYWRVAIRVPGGQIHRPVHQLVLEAFVGPRPEGLEVRHLDGNAENNHWQNLMWGTTLENAQDRKDHGTQVNGERHYMAKLTAAQVAEIRAHLPMWKKGDGRKFAKRFGVGDSTISGIKRNIAWHG